MHIKLKLDFPEMFPEKQQTKYAGNGKLLPGLSKQTRFLVERCPQVEFII